MNKLIMFIVLIIVHLTSQAWASSYLLHLKNGNELRTSYYWEEDDQIMFFIYGGIAGIQRGFVTKVTPSDLTYKGGQIIKESKEDNQISLIPISPKSQGIPRVQRSEVKDKFNQDIENDVVVNFNYYRE